MEGINLQNKKVLVIGAGVSGIAVCRFLLAKGAKVVLADSKSAAELGDVGAHFVRPSEHSPRSSGPPPEFPGQALDASASPEFPLSLRDIPPLARGASGGQGAELEDVGAIHESPAVGDARSSVRNGDIELLFDGRLPDTLDMDFCVKSPGVPQTIELLQRLHLADIPVISELELTYLFAKAPFIAITGTNGKTTTTALLGFIAERAGLNPLVGGNIGTPLINSAEDHQGVVIVEVSSFQLEDCYAFAPHIAVFLNLTPDHLDRHGDMAGYLAAKERIFAAQGVEDIAILNYDDEIVRGIGERIKSRVIYFSRKEELPEGIFIEEGKIIIRLDGKNINLMPAADIYIKGDHNLENALAAVAAAYIHGILPDVIASSLAAFPGVEHRLEVFLEKDGVFYINDSKGTNPDSTIKALTAYDRPIILIAGGYDKNSDFSDLMKIIKNRVKYLVLIGATKEKLAAAAEAEGFSDYTIAKSFDEAVKLACNMAAEGDVVMLSPACASWDMFRNFEERGRRFKEIIAALI